MSRERLHATSNGSNGNGPADQARPDAPSAALLSEDAWRHLAGSRLREARQRKGLLLRDLSETKPDWSISRIASYEQGVRSMSVVVAYALSQKLGVSAAWLLALDSTLGFAAEELDVISRYRRASDEVKALVKQLLSLGV